jgi:DNA invertase Pin-like site-specific DNA recombinase
MSIRRKIGYARVSKIEQNLDMQIDALSSENCSKIFTDKVTGAKAERPGMNDCLEELKEGDILVVWRIDRLGRSMSHLVQIIEQLTLNGIGFKSIQDGAIDTTTASGELIFNMFSALAQFERRLIQERTMAGLAAARARGKFGGRPKLEPDDHRIKTAKIMHVDRNIRIEDICKTLNISRSTLYRYLKY